MRTEDDDIETRLRKFRPRRPAMIPDQRLQLLRGPLWIATAAAIAAAMLITSWIERPRPQPPAPAATVGALTALAVESPDQLDAVLTRMSGTLLPDVRDAFSPARQPKESQ